MLIGADGIDSLVRRTLWGDSPKREHNLHIFGGFTFDDTVDAEPGLCVVSHSRTVQGSWTSIRQQGPRRIPVVGARRPRRQDRVHRRPARHRD